MPRNHARQAFLELMRALFEQQKSDWSMEQPNRRSDGSCSQIIYQSQWKLLGRFEEFDWKGNVGFAQRHCAMLLPPLDKDGCLCPVMSLEYLPCDDFDRSSLYIHVLLLKGWDERKLLGFGFRIESPHAYGHRDETNDEVGRHDFYHAQLVSGMGHGATLDLPDWWPCTQPSFPLWAVNPVDAVLNLILTLYGVPYYKKFLTSHSSRFLGGASEEFEALHKRLQGTGTGG